jgi:polyhydroxybutyrate depolymerase
VQSAAIIVAGADMPTRSPGDVLPLERLAKSPPAGYPRFDRGNTMHTSITTWSFASLVVGSALVVVACGNSGADSSKGVAGSSQDGSSATSSGGARDTPSSGDTASSSGGTADTPGSGDTVSSSGGRAGNTGGTTGGGSTDHGDSGGDTQGGATSGGGGAVSTGGSQTTGAGGSSSAGSGARGGTAGGSGSGGDTTGGRGGGATGSGGLTDPLPSQGCGKDPPADGYDTIDVGGTTREYILRLPEGYDGTTPNRIIFTFHGASGSAVQVDNGDPPRSDLDPTGPYYGIKDEADHQTIFVAGQALSGWSNSNGRDIDYVRALLDRFEGELCIDESRIFATGFSMGAIMTITVACNLSDVFRAVAPMSGSLQNGCPEGGQHIAYWSSHGTSDTTIDISQGEAARDAFVQRNHCQAGTTPTEPSGCVSYQGCDSGYPVDWCPFDGAHEPPPFSGSAIWAFLSQF